MFSQITWNIDPEIAADTIINLSRVTISNCKGQLKPGMPAYIIVKSKEVKTLTLLLNTVLRGGKMNIVWVQSGKNKFKMKMVETGLESSERIEIKSGLETGVEVVTNGA